MSTPKGKSTKLPDNSYAYTDPEGAMDQMSELLTTGLYSDCVVVAGKGKAKIKTHAAVLSARCAVIDGMLRATREINLSAYSEPCVRTFLQCVYTGKVRLAVDEVPELVRLSQEFKFEDLRNSCESVLIDTLDASNVNKLLATAKESNLPNLQAACMNVIGRETASMFVSKPFLDTCSLEFLESLVQLDELYASEVDLFDFVRRWGVDQLRKKSVPPTVENLREAVSTLLPHIRLGIIPPKDLMHQVISSKLFDKKQILTALCYHAYPAGFKAEAKTKSYTPRSREFTIRRYSTPPSASSSWSFSGSNCDAIQFTVSKACIFAGIGCFIGSGSTTSKLEFLSGSTSLGKGEATFSASSKDAKIHPLRLATPVPCSPGVTYTIKLHQRGPNACYIQSAKTSITHEGITVKIKSCSSISTNSTSNTRGQIPELYFRY